jgi:hypothetical protein
MFFEILSLLAIMCYVCSGEDTKTQKQEIIITFKEKEDNDTDQHFVVRHKHTIVENERSNERT